MDSENLDRVIWNKTEASWYGIPVGEYTYREFLAKFYSDMKKTRKKIAEQN